MQKTTVSVSVTEPDSNHDRDANFTAHQNIMVVEKAVNQCDQFTLLYCLP